MNGHRPKQTAARTLVVALILSLVCSIAVSVSSVLLKPVQEANRDRDRQKNVLSAAGLLRPGEDVATRFEELIETRILDLDTASFAADIDPVTYRHRKATRDPAQTKPLAEAEDIAQIGRRERYVPVYLTHDERGRVDRIILPVRGYALWSTLWGYLAVQGDGNTVIGLSFYAHGETPGLGGEIDNPQWKALWPGKKIYADGLDAVSSATYQPRPTDDVSSWPLLRVAAGAAPGDAHRVDGLAGATLTNRGINNLLHYWLGADGYGPFLAKVRARGLR